MTASPRYFAILGAMRTGSNLLEKTLEHLGDTVCYGEAFNPSFISGPRKKKVLGYTVETRDADPIGFLETLIAAEPSRIAGLRIFVGHNQEVTDYILRDPRCFRIVLTRDPVDSYISLKIARKTDQWMLRNPRRRTTTRIRFDEKDFIAYRNRLQAYYAAIDAGLAKYETDAFRIDYTDLGNRALLQELANRMGSTGQVPAKPPILRQNPGNWAQKVENHVEMCEVLNLPTSRQDEPTQPLTPVMRPDGFGVGYAPIYGNAFEPMVALLHRIEVRDFSRARIPAPELFDMASRQVLFVADDPGDAPVITMVSDPFRRLHAVFLKEVFGPGAQFSVVRRALQDRVGPVPPPRRIANGKAEYSAERHQQHFAGFLNIVEEALSSDSEIEPAPDWQAQSDLLQPFCDRIQIEKIFRHEAFADAVHWLTLTMKLPPFPPGQINGMRQAGRLDLLPIQQVITPRLTDRVFDLHSADYQRFGYQRLTPEAE